MNCFSRTIALISVGFGLAAVALGQEPEQSRSLSTPEVGVPAQEGVGHVRPAAGGATESPAQTGKQRATESRAITSGAAATPTRPDEQAHRVQPGYDGNARDALKTGDPRQAQPVRDTQRELEAVPRRAGADAVRSDSKARGPREESSSRPSTPRPRRRATTPPRRDATGSRRGSRRSRWSGARATSISRPMTRPCSPDPRSRGPTPETRSAQRSSPRTIATTVPAGMSARRRPSWPTARQRRPRAMSTGRKRPKPSPSKSAISTKRAPADQVAPERCGRRWAVGEPRDWSRAERPNHSTSGHARGRWQAGHSRRRGPWRAHHTAGPAGKWSAPGNQAERSQAERRAA